MGYPFPLLYLYYTILLSICQPLLQIPFYDLDVIRLNPRFTLSGNAPVYYASGTGYLFGVLQGLPRSPQPSMLSMPAATPHAVLVRSGSTLYVGWEWLAVPPLVHRHCGRSVAPLPSSLQVYYTTNFREKQEGKGKIGI